MWSTMKMQNPVPGWEAQEAPVTRIAVAIIFQAIREKANRVQLIPHGAGLRVEYLLGETWTETMSIPAHLASPLTEQYKKAAGLPLGYRMALEGLIFIRSAEDGKTLPILAA